MTSAFHLYYFIDSRASMPVHIVSMHLGFPFPLPFSSSQFQPQESYFEKWVSRKQIFSHCCCWLIQLFDHVANGHRLRKWNLQLLMINCQRLVEASGCKGSWLFLCHPQKIKTVTAEIHHEDTKKKDAAFTDYNLAVYKVLSNSRNYISWKSKQCTGTKCDFVQV